MGAYSIIAGRKRMERRTITFKKGKKAISHNISSLRQTAELARHVVDELHGGDVIALRGNLGTGKTTFTQFLAHELRVRNRVTSPTFVLMKVYSVHNRSAHNRGIQNLCHIDAYRMGGTESLRAIGAEEYIGRQDTVTVIEWAERVKGILGSNTLWISFSHAV